MNTVLICTIVLVLVVVIVVFSKKENFSPEYSPVGGVTTSKIQFSDSSTVVNILTGNSGQTIILVHNTPFTNAIWEPIFDHAYRLYKRGIKIPTLISYDLMGNGTGWVPVPDQYNDANANNRAWNMGMFVDQLHKIYLKYVSPQEKATFVGYGSGSAIVQEYALTWPNTVDKLYAMMFNTGTVKAVNDPEREYLSGWIRKNPNVTFLTMEQSFLTNNLCRWFENPNPLQCPGTTDTIDETQTYQYDLARQLFREANCQAYLQNNKMIAGVDLDTKWNRARVSFPTTFLIANRDYYTDTEIVKKNIVKIQTQNTAKLYIVNGKHGFPMMNPMYIYDMITGHDMTNNPSTIDTI